MNQHHELKNILLKCFDEALDGEDLNLESDFSIMGIDSMSAFSFTSNLKEIIPSIPLTIFLECSNVAELQQYIMKNHQNELNQYLEGMV